MTNEEAKALGLSPILPWWAEFYIVCEGEPAFMDGAWRLPIVIRYPLTRPCRDFSKFFVVS
jgi:hypothetical protein